MGNKISFRIDKMKGYALILMVIVSVYCYDILKKDLVEEVNAYNTQLKKLTGYANDKRKDVQDYDHPTVVVAFDENNTVHKMQIDRNTGILSNLTQTTIDSSIYKISFAKSLRDNIWVGCFKKDHTAQNWDNSTLFMFQYDQNLKQVADIDLSSSGVKYTTNMLDIGYTTNGREKPGQVSTSTDSKNFVYVYEKALSSNWYKSVNEDNIFAFEYTEEESKPQMTLVKVLPARQLWLPSEFDSFSLVRILDTHSCTDMCYHSITVQGRSSRHYSMFVYETILFDIKLNDATWDSFDYDKTDFRQNGSMIQQLSQVMDMQSVFGDVKEFAKALGDLSKQFPNDSEDIVNNLKMNKMLHN